MYRVMIQKSTDYETYDMEYSGEHYRNIEDAEAECLDAKQDTVDDETIDRVYIEEF